MAVREHLRRIGLDIRSGVHAGECEESGGKLVGIAVHIGSRLLGIAQPGEVLVSSTVRDLVAGSGIEFDDRGEHTLKGIAGQWHLYTACAAGPGPARPLVLLDGGHIAGVEPGAAPAPDGCEVLEMPAGDRWPR
jgi:class 3 adenylate cyclase